MPKLIDTTLREGEQTPGLHLPLALKKRIASGLAASGIDEIELGVAAASDPGDTSTLCHYLRSRLVRQPYSLWCRCRAEDIRFAASCRPHVLSLSIPASDLHLSKKFGKDRAWALATAATAIRQARALGIERVALGLEDASRAEPTFLAELARCAAEAGAFRLRLADTVGIADPLMMAELVKGVAGCGLELAVHCHNDFGMATANTIAALGAGADWGDVTLLGLGERAGNSRIEEVMAYLAIQAGISKYKIGELIGLSRMVARTTGEQITPRQPLLGADIFNCQSGIHQHGLLKDPTTYEPYDPKLVGANRRLLMGATSGRHALAAALEGLNLSRPTEADLGRLWQHMRHKAARIRRPLNEQELSKLAREGGITPS